MRVTVPAALVRKLMVLATAATCMTGIVADSVPPGMLATVQRLPRPSTNNDPWDCVNDPEPKIVVNYTAY